MYLNVIRHHFSIFISMAMKCCHYLYFGKFWTISIPKFWIWTKNIFLLEFVIWRWCLVFSALSSACLFGIDFIAWNMSFPSYWSLLHLYDSSVSDIQIYHALHSLITVCKIVSLQSVGLSYLDRVTCLWIILLSLLPVAWYGFAKFCHYTAVQR